MARRTHTKSRRGCFTCKRRHIKCDENHPACINCRTSQRICSYPDGLQGSTTRAHSSSATASPAASSSTAGYAPTPQSSVQGYSNPLNVPLPESTSVSPDDLAINMRHMQYLSHFLLVTCHSIGLSLPSLGEDNTIAFTMTGALRVPHLLCAMLSLAAFHLGHRTDATAFQTRALELFNGTPHLTNLTPDSAAPTFQFASLVGIYKLADASLSCEGDDAALLDRFIEYVDVHSGLRAVIGASWSSISQSALRPTIAPFEEDIQRFQQNQTEGQGEFPQLRELVRNLEAAESNTNALDSYKDAVKHLQWAFHLAQRCPSGQAAPSPGAVFAWPVMVSSHFIMLLQQRRPEALVILAHYGALLHKHRELWVIGNVGSRVVGAVTTLLGRYWRPWLECPNAIVSETHV